MNGRAWWLIGVMGATLLAGCLPVRGPLSLIYREQRRVAVRDPATLPRAPIPDVPPPATVLEPVPDTVVPDRLSLDEAIRIGLRNSEVVRVLTGVVATSSGSTIYDPAISNTTIDEQSGVFNPVLTLGNFYNRLEQPFALPVQNNPSGAAILGNRVDNYDLNLDLMKRTILGGTFNLGVLDNSARFSSNSAILNPQDRYSTTLSYTHPLLRGAGIGPNLAPIVIARINTEQTYFQYKNSVQELVRGTIEAYWAVVFARTDVWVRRQQVEQGQFAYDLAEARTRVGLGDASQTSQSRVALANFRVGLIGSEANLLQREDALRNLLGLSPTTPWTLVPVTPSMTARVRPIWEELLRLAEQRRPDVIASKLVIEADQQALLLARNQARPQLDASTFTRWNGLEGETFRGDRLASGPGQFTDWTAGVNLSVPIGLRSSRASFRRAELNLLRDRANLEQSLHNAAHLLSLNVRNLDQFYAQYQALGITRAAASLNLDQQLAEFRSGRVIFLNVLQAISDWGNAVSSEAQTLAQYNTELANLEFQTGTILETHGVRFFEERFQSLGPLGDLGPTRDYPAALPAGPNLGRYPVVDEPADAALEREKPALPEPGPSEPAGEQDPLLPPALEFEDDPPPGEPS